MEYYSSIADIYSNKCWTRIFLCWYAHWWLLVGQGHETPGNRSKKILNTYLSFTKWILWNNRGFLLWAYHRDLNITRVAIKNIIWILTGFIQNSLPEQIRSIDSSKSLPIEVSCKFFCKNWGFLKVKIFFLTWRLIAMVSWSALSILRINSLVSCGTDIVAYIRAFRGICRVQ